MTDTFSNAISIESVSGTGISIRGGDIDTDQIIPARYLKAITFDGLGEFAFRDVRFQSDGEEIPHPFNDKLYRDASILVVNSNFGCGSSREHAPQALMRWGIKAVIGESFAEIFSGNCLALGVPIIEMDQGGIKKLQEWTESTPSGEIEINIVDQTINYNGEIVEVKMPDSHSKALVEGIWDTTSLLKSNPDEVRRISKSIPYIK
tara:strand:- start:1308 stop:1922 length:615 start_codon:yes stop_codon:yes gene_type:complete